MKFNHHIYCIIFSLTIVNLVFGQQNNYQNISEPSFQNIKNAFVSEFNIDSTQEHTTKYQNNYSKIQLPDWLFTKLGYINEKFISIGISDPIMPINNAKSLALFRAKQMISLYAKTMTSGLSDYYKENKNMDLDEINYSLFQELFSFESSFTLYDSAVQIIKEYYTQNGEAIVLISYEPNAIHPINKDSTKLLVYAEVYNAWKKGSFYQNHDIVRYEMLSGYKDKSLQESNYNTFLFKKRNRSLRLHSNNNGVKQDYGKVSLFYHSNQQVKPKDLSFFTLEKGLWNAFSLSFFNALINNLSSEQYLKKLNDQSINNSQEIIRLKTQKQIEIKHISFNIYQNKLYINTEINPIEN